MARGSTPTNMEHRDTFTLDRRYRTAGAAAMVLLLFPLASNGAWSPANLLPADAPQEEIQSVRTITPLDRGLKALAGMQQKDGSWHADDGGHVASSSLAVLAFLGAGHGPRHGPYNLKLRRGISWLKKQIDENGHVGRPKPPSALHDRMLCALALSEAYGMTRYRLLKAAAHKLVADIVAAQEQNGGWAPHPDAGPDALVTAWAMMAIGSARTDDLLGELRVEAELALKRGAQFLDTLTDQETGRVGLSLPGTAAPRNPGAEERFPAALTEEVTAAAMAMRVLAGEGENSPALVRAATLLNRNLPRSDAPSTNQLYWYFGTIALFQVGGKSWDSWHAAMKSEIAASQITIGERSGMWKRRGPWSGPSGDATATALGTMCIAVCYRDTEVLAPGPVRQR